MAFVSCAGTVGVCFVAGGASCGGSGESGTMAFFSWIEFTTFSRSMGAMCLPRTWLLVESWRRRSGRDDELERVVAVRAQSTAESSEAMLEESSGTSSTTALLASKDQGEGAEWTGWQQKVSRDQTLQAWVIVSGGSGSKRAGDSPCFHSACRPPWQENIWRRLKGSVSVVGGSVGAASSCERHAWKTRRDAHTGPQSKQILRIARFDCVHGAVLDAHDGARSVQRHILVGRRGCVGARAVYYSYV